MPVHPLTEEPFLETQAVPPLLQLHIVPSGSHGGHTSTEIVRILSLFCCKLDILEAVFSVGIVRTHLAVIVACPHAQGHIF